MSWSVAALVLLSALLHASWNALTKSSGDPLVSIALMIGIGGLAIGSVIPFVPLPAPAAWPYVAASLVLHLAYQLTLVAAYRYGELSLVYPIARGLAPLGVALLAALWVHELPSVVRLVGLLLASGAIASLARTGRTGTPERAVAWAVVTASLISAYTVVDGYGARVAGNALSFAAWALMLDAIPIVLVALAVRRASLLELLRRQGRRSAIGGTMAVTGYAIVLWAMTVSPMATVSAVRESSVLFAAWIGARVFHEQFGKQRMVAAAILVIGLALVRA